jgi:hypothetical protein
MSNIDRDHFTMIPNIVRELQLPAYALGLYMHVVSTAGCTGKCYKSARTLAKALRCSVGTITNAKRELLRKHWMLEFKPLIEIQQVRRTQGGKPLHVITAVDIWADNTRYFSERKRLERIEDSSPKLTDDVPRSYADIPSPPDDVPSSYADIPSSSGDVASSPNEIKNTSSKNKLGRKTIEVDLPPSLSASSRERESELAPDVSKLWSFLSELFGRDAAKLPTRRERKLLLHWCPVPTEEYEHVRWWMALDEREYHYGEGAGYLLRRRPRSIGALLQKWGNVNDIARYYFQQQLERGDIY